MPGHTEHCMSESDRNLDWQQHYPTYKFLKRDVLLREYESAARSVESNERIFLGLINIILLASTALISIGTALLSKPSFANLALRIPFPTILSLMLTGGLFSFLSLHHFAGRHKSVVIDSRKIIVLRRMLGLDYGRMQLILPNERLEGATRPFSIKMFPGWLSPAAYPFWIVGAFTSLILFNAWPSIAARALTQFSDIFWLPNGSSMESLSISTAWLSILAISFRQNLLDTNEHLSLVFTKCLAGILGIRLVSDFEDVLYRARLAAYEAERLHIDSKSVIPILIFIEDREFRAHNGLSWRGIARATLGLLGQRRKSGGSTITQQLARSLFIIDLNKKFRRKVIEILLAKWLENLLSKGEILNLYLGAVRFDNGVYGLPAAHKHYFNNMRWESIGKPEAFFLVERVSNISGAILANKIADTVRQLIDNGLLTPSDALRIADLYGLASNSGKLKTGGIKELVNKIGTITNPLATAPDTQSI